MAATNHTHLPAQFHLTGHHHHHQQQQQFSRRTSSIRQTSEYVSSHHASANGIQMTSQLNATSKHDTAPGDHLQQLTGKHGTSGVSAHHLAAHMQLVMKGMKQAWCQITQLMKPPLAAYTFPLLLAWVGMCGGWYSTVLWIPEYFKIRGAGKTNIYAETFAVACANLPGKGMYRKQVCLAGHI